MRVARALDGSTDWLVLPGLAWDDELPKDRPAAGAGQGAAARGFTWLSAVCTTLGESAIYAGIAAGGQAEGLKGMWQLAVLAVSSVAVARLTRQCRGDLVGAGPGAGTGGTAGTAATEAGPGTAGTAATEAGPGTAGTAGTEAGPGAALSSARADRGRAMWQWADKCLAPPTSARVLLATAGLMAVGPRLALFVVLAVEVGAIGCTLALLGKVGPADPSVVLACRDDGPVARWAGRLVQGNLIPLPPAFAGVIATALLAGLGLRNLPGIIAVTPPVVMMLAGPGSSHRHDGRFDWLAPVLIALGQYVYLASLGFALSVPGPAVFAACALTATWQVGLRGLGAPGALSLRAGGQSASAGWEARMFLPGLAAMLGLATFGYLGLAAYLGARICRKVVSGYLIPREAVRR